MKDRIAVRLMTDADLAFADSVRAAAGWNQTEKDWRRLLEYQPDGCFVAECNGTPAGTATTTCYGTELAWIGMVLVYPEYRRRGIGRALMLHCLDFLGRKAIRCIKLDATPLGKLLYDQLGFHEEWSLTRWELNPSSAPLPSGSQSGLRPWHAGDAERLDHLDRSALGMSRLEMLKRLAQDSSVALVHESVQGKVSGYGMSRPGSRAGYVGPVVAVTPSTAAALVDALISHQAGRTIYWDIPDGNAAASGLAKQWSFTPQRHLLRMFRGPTVGSGNLAQYYAIADPGIG